METLGKKTEASLRFMPFQGVLSAYIGDYGAIALDDVRTVMTLQHDIQVHQNPLVLVLVSCAAHLLETQIIYNIHDPSSLSTKHVWKPKNSSRELQSKHPLVSAD